MKKPLILFLIILAAAIAAGIRFYPRLVAEPPPDDTLLVSGNIEVHESLLETKEKLYQAVLENLFQQLHLSLREPLSRTPAPRAALLGFVDRYINFLQQHPNYPRLLQREIMERGPYLHVVVERYLGPIFSSLARILRAGIRRGEFRSVDVNQTVVSLIAITVFYFAATPVMSLVLGGNAYDARRVAVRKRAVVDFIRHGLLRSPHQKPSAATNRKRAKKNWRKR